MSTLAVSNITDAAGGNTATINSCTPTVYNTMGRNRIINGDMRIDQRNAGASVAVSNGTNTFITDRWSAYENTSGGFSFQQVSDAPTGFNYSLKCTVTSAATLGASDISQVKTTIEGYNCADFLYGTANAKTSTLSFWVKSSLTGQFGGSCNNSGITRSYPFSFTISSADTWEKKTITIPGDTGGTWLTTNGIGLYLIFDLGISSNRRGTANTWAAADYRGVTGDVNLIETNGATWQITGVQLEVGSVATEFERRPIGVEMMLCKRYFDMVFNTDAISGRPLNTPGSVSGGTSGSSTFFFQHQVEMRTGPSVIFTNPTVCLINWPASGSNNINGTPALWGTNNPRNSSISVGYGGGAANFTTGASVVLDFQSNAVFAFNAEL